MLFLVLYSALEYLLGLAFHGVAGTLRGPAEFLATSATLAAAIIAGSALLSSLDARRTGALGFAWTRQTPRELIQGLALGGGGIVAAVVIMLAIGALRYSGDDGTAAGWVGTMLWHLLVFTVAAAAEEAVFRGYAFQALARGFGGVPAVVVTSALFALAHARNPNVGTFALLNIFLAGVMLGAAYLKTMSLWFATAVHTGWNWAMASLFDLPVSGIAMFDAPLYEPRVTGGWVSGGAFGPEGGLVGTLGFAAMLAALLWLMHLRVAPEMAALRPIALTDKFEETKAE